VIVTQERIPHARIITPAKTFVKHAFVMGDGEARVERQGQTLATLTDVSAEFVGGVHRVEGKNEGREEIWKVDNLGCGCRNVPQVFDTDERDRPT
jgi:hypothetical protein